jgi:hypothetical protein
MFFRVPKKKQRKSSFLKKEAKDFYLWRLRQDAGLASIVGAAEKQKSFGSFLQKRTTLPLFIRAAWLLSVS